MIVIYLSIAFEWRMAVAALIALVHDIVITIGVYALAGFEVSPATVIGLLTILGYSLYDTVVVFDKVRENTAGLLSSSRSTYSQAANLALNQTLVRSINTSIIALLPVAAILFIGGGRARRRRAQRPGAGAVRRHAVRHLLLHLHRHPGAGRPQGARSAVQGAGQAGRAQGIRRPGRQAGRRQGDAPGVRGIRGRRLRRAGGRRCRPGRMPPRTDAAPDDAAAPGDEAAAPDEKVPVGPAVPRPPGPSSSPGPRQQPRRSPSSARRRPSGKKKRR